MGLYDLSLALADPKKRMTDELNCEKVDGGCGGVHEVRVHNGEGSVCQKETVRERERQGRSERKRERI